MAKLWLFLVLAIAIALLVRAASARKGSKAAAGRGTTAGSVHQSEEMVPCAFCSLNVPLSEAVGSGPQFFCSQEHMRRKGA